jgi:hypothetical protein
MDHRLNTKEGNRFVVFANHYFITPFFVHLNEYHLHPYKHLSTLPKDPELQCPVESLLLASLA